MWFIIGKYSTGKIKYTRQYYTRRIDDDTDELCEYTGGGIKCFCADLYWMH